MRFFAQKAKKMPAGAGYLGVFLLVTAIYGWLQMRQSFMDPDSFYHVKMAVLMLQRGIIRDFPWLPYTTLAHAYTDHHFIYHVLLIPFILAFGPLVGAKVATAVFGGLTMVSFYAVLKAHGSRWPAAFTMVLATSSAFMFRMNLTKTSALSVAVLMLALLAIKKEKPLALFFLSWVYVLLYGGWPIMGVVVAVFLCTRAVIDHLLDKHPVHSWAGLWFWKRLLRGSKTAKADFWRAIEVRHAAAAAAGLLAGLVINPYFPKNLAFYWEQIVQIAVVGYKDKIGVGVEWYPYQANQFFIENSAIFLGFAVCLTVLFCMVFWNDLVRRGPEQIPRQEITSQLASFFLAAFFTLMTMRSRRHVEYFAPFSVMSLALFFTMLTSRLDFNAFVGRIRWLFPRPKVIPLAIMTYVSFLFVFLGVRDVMANKQLYSGGIPWTKYAKAADWLTRNTPEGAIVLHSDWDDFPVLFFQDDRNRYIIGLDPTFLYRQDPDRYWEWVNITTGKTASGIAEAALNRFDSRYILVENDHTEMRKQVDLDPRIERVYQDEDARIYKVR
ncbi:MAG TPA: hypothetical protein VL500_06275 [Candidatus Eisenbacteria bacterium]|nr:hypothetical protein [Candidatus Eisenbacteria bacterium]